MHNPEYRLTSSSGQDRSVKHKNYARETDKGTQNGWIYSPIYRMTGVTKACYFPQ